MRLQRQKRREQRKVSRRNHERAEEERHAQWLHLASLSAPSVGASSPLCLQNASETLRSPSAVLHTVGPAGEEPPTTHVGHRNTDALDDQLKSQRAGWLASVRPSLDRGAVSFKQQASDTVHTLDEVMLEEPLEQAVEEHSLRSNSSAYSKLNSIPEGGSSGGGRKASFLGGGNRSRQGSLASVSAGSRKSSLIGWLAGSRAASASSENLLESSERDRLSCIASCREGEEEDGSSGATHRMSFEMADREVDHLQDVATDDTAADVDDDLVALSVSASAWARVSAGSSACD